MVYARMRSLMRIVGVQKTPRVAGLESSFMITDMFRIVCASSAGLFLALQVRSQAAE